MTDRDAPLALIAGASRGIGLGLVREWLSRGWSVIGTARGEGTALHGLAATETRLRTETLDVTDAASIAALRERLEGARLDLLFVNAGIARGEGDQVDRLSDHDFTEIMRTNALAPLRVIEALGPLVRPEGMIAAMSSSLGSVSMNEGGTWEIYRASKAALNTLMRSYAARHRAGTRSLALVDPGWVRTEMGGPGALLTVEESTSGIADALARRAGQPGLRYLNHRGETLPW